MYFRTVVRNLSGNTAVLHKFFNFVLDTGFAIINKFFNNAILQATKLIYYNCTITSVFFQPTTCESTQKKSKLVSKFLVNSTK